MVGRLQGLHALHVAHDGVRDAVRAAVALLGGVHDAELQGVDAKLLCQLVHDALGGVARLRGARRAVGRGLRLVHHHVVGVDEDVLDVVGREHALRARADRRTGVRAGLEDQLGVGGRDFTPSFVAPILQTICAPDAGPVPSKTSERVIVILTGRPDFFDNAAAGTSR